MFEGYSFDTLMDRMLSNVSDRFDKREGSVIYDALAPAALELSRFYISLDMVLDEVFADSASYHYLIKRAAERGIYPEEETCAICRMEVLPVDTAVSIGDRFHLGGLNYTVSSVIDAGAGVYQLECETPGTIGNQQLGELLPVETSNDINNMETAKITEILVPGEEEEDVETFRGRYFASLSSDAFGGNKTDYKEKVNSINGIGGCKVTRAWESGFNPSSMIPGQAVSGWFSRQSVQTLGEETYSWLEKVYNAAVQKLLTTGGTVKVVVINSEYKPPSSALVKIVQDTLDPVTSAGEGDGIAPVGHVVNVTGVRGVPVNVSAVITYMQGFSFETLKASIQEMLDNYFWELSQSWADEDRIVVRTGEIESRLLKLEGISDVTDVTLDGPDRNLVLDSDAIPVRGDISG